MTCLIQLGPLDHLLDILGRPNQGHIFVHVLAHYH